MQNTIAQSYLGIEGEEKMNNYLKNKTLVNRLCSSGGMTLALGAAFVAFSLPNSAQGQEAQRVLEEIIVTAAYREQGLQDVPVSISAVMLIRLSSGPTISCVECEPSM